MLHHASTSCNIVKHAAWFSKLNSIIPYQNVKLWIRNGVTSSYIILKWPNWKTKRSTIWPDSPKFWNSQLVRSNNNKLSNKGLASHTLGDVLSGCFSQFPSLQYAALHQHAQEQFLDTAVEKEQLMRVRREVKIYPKSVVLNSSMSSMITKISRCKMFPVCNL